MHKCPKCGSENQEENKFCGNCGFKLPEPKICPECGFTSFEDKFCTECGEQLLPKYICKKIKNTMKKAGDLGFRRNKKEDAIELCDEILKTNPDYSKALDYKASFLSRLKNYDEAMECIEKALKISPHNTSFISTKVSIFNSMKKYDESINYIDSILDSNPSDDSLFQTKGDIFLSMGNYEEASIFYGKSLDINPENRISVIMKILALKHLERYDEALQCCEFFKIDKYYPSSYYTNKIEIYMLMKDYDKAIACCVEWQKSQPESYYILSKKGDIYYEMGRYNAALRCYDEVLDNRPDDEDALIGKAEVLIKKGNFDEANDILSKFSSKYNLKWVRLAEVYKKLHNLEKALECCDESLKINENYGALFLKAEIYFELKQYGEAMNYAKRAFEIDSSNEKLKELMDNIKESQ